jgi:hypothetical protein
MAQQVIPPGAAIASEPWLAWQNLHLERNGALFEVHGLVRFKAPDTADIVRDAILRQQPAAFREEIPQSLETMRLVNFQGF